MPKFPETLHRPALRAHRNSIGKKNTSAIVTHWSYLSGAGWVFSPCLPIFGVPEIEADAASDSVSDVVDMLVDSDDEVLDMELFDEISDRAKFYAAAGC